MNEEAVTSPLHDGALNNDASPRSPRAHGATIREIVAHILQNDGHSVEFVDHGKEALRKILQARFDLIVADHRMPHIDCVQLAALISTRRIPFILLSGMDERNDCSLTGVSHVLTKPISAKELREAVKKVAEEDERNLEKETA